MNRWRVCGDRGTERARRREGGVCCAHRALFVSLCSRARKWVVVLGSLIHLSESNLFPSVYQSRDSFTISFFFFKLKTQLKLLLNICTANTECSLKVPIWLFVTQIRMFWKRSIFVLLFLVTANIHKRLMVILWCLYKK